MKLWEIKAHALRLMFADTDMNFDESDFNEAVVYNNPNTREKLVRMNDSIMRAIDLFYQYNGEMTRSIQKGLLYDEVEEEYKNVIDFLDVQDFGFPTRVDISGNKSDGLWKRNNLEFMYDEITKRIYFTEYDFKYHEDKVVFVVYYRIKKTNIPSNVDEMEFDLNTLYIPEEIQRQIPLFVKSEIFEEDEPTMAMKSRNEYIEFLIHNRRKIFGKSRSKVRRQFPWGSE